MTHDEARAAVAEAGYMRTPLGAPDHLLAPDGLRLVILEQALAELGLEVDE
jgi:hypothetical protein